MTITLRDATPSDTQFIAWTVMTAIALEEADLDRFERMCEGAESLYSWKHSRLAIADGRPAGCLISYPGEVYATLREKTWRKFWDQAPAGADSPESVNPDAMEIASSDAGDSNDSAYNTESVPAFEPETFPGEYYLDSLAVLPEYRRHGIASVLLKDGIALGRTKGFSRITLIAESQSLAEFYSTLGFVAEGHMTLFGHRYTRMSLINP